MDWLTASLWVGIVTVIFLLAIRFLLHARKEDVGSVRRHTYLVLFIVFMLLCLTKLFDLLIVNLGAAPEPIPFLADRFGVLPEDHFLGLLVMSLYLVAFSVLLFGLERYTLNTKYVLTIIPLAVILIAWLLTLRGIKIDLFLTELYMQKGSWILLIFFVPRSFVPFAYLYLAIKTPGTIETPGTYRWKALSLFFGYGIMTTFFVRQPSFEFIGPYIIITGLIFIIWGYKQA